MVSIRKYISAISKKVQGWDNTNKMYMPEIHLLLPPQKTNNAKTKYSSSAYPIPLPIYYKLCYSQFLTKATKLCKREL